MEPNQLLIKDFFVYMEGGKRIFSLDASFDLSKLPSDQHTWVINWLADRRMTFNGIPQETLEQMDRRFQRYEEALTAYLEMPWYRQLWHFRKFPRLTDF